MKEAPVQPLITAVIPTYRRPKMLRRAIKSVLAQTYPHLQVCVYDDASGDETASVVAEIAKVDPRVRYFCHPKNIGWLKGFAYAIEQVDTPFFSLLGDDDLLLPRFFETALVGFEEHPEAMFSATASIWMDDQGHILGVPVLRWEPGFYLPPEGLRTMLKRRHAEWPGVLFRREILDKVGNLDEQAGGPADVDLEFRIAARFPFVISTEPGAIFVAHSLSIGFRSRFDTAWPGWLKVIRNLAEDEGIPSDVRKYAARVLTERLRRGLFWGIGFGSIVLRNWEDAYKAAEVLGSYYHLNAQALLLRTSAKACQYLPPAYHFLCLLYTLRKSLRRKNRRLQRNYGAYARLLEL